MRAVRAVVDANVWVAGFLNPDGPPGRILAAIRDGRVRALANDSLAVEIAEVLCRPRILRLGVGPEDFRDAMVLLDPLIPDVTAAYPIRDPDDEPVLAAALTGRAEVIVTGDGDFLDDPVLQSLLAEKGITVETPTQFLRRL